MLLQAYLDESDRPDGEQPICVAGYVFKPRQYSRFAREWAAFLRDSKLTHLHMTDLYAGKGECRGLTGGKGPLFGRAVDIITEHTLCGVAVMFDQKEFEAAAPPWFASFQGSIYSTACQITLRTTAFLLSELGYRQLVDYTFDQGYRFAGEANAIITRIASVSDASEQYRYHSHAFADMKRTAGLQAADVLAWTIARARCGFPDNKSIAAFEPHIRRLAKESRKHSLQIFTGRKLRLFFEEQRDRPGDYYFKKPLEMRNRLR
jgi:hypothetical protein